jgi:UDP-N-acetylmuramate dehydrogenase
MTQKLVNFSIKHGLKGLENFAGLPGTIGGAVYKNSHFKSSFMSDNLDKVKVLDSNNRIKFILKDQLHFSYNFSSFQETGDVILTVYFKLSKGNKKKLEKAVKTVLDLRWKKHPMIEKSAGCVFKNPADKPAGILIEKANLKGKKIGQAMISLKHAAFIVNTGNATSQDVLDLIEKVKKKVAKKFNLNLHEEIFFIGEQ